MMNSSESSGGLSLYQYIQKSSNPFKTLKTIFSTSICNWVNEYFRYTRDFEGGLYFVEYCYGIINYNRSEITVDEYEKWDTYLIMLKLNMLDHLNYWNEYIQYFELVMTTKSYKTCIYAKNRNIVKSKYIISEQEDIIIVHFLWMADERYEIIRRKCERHKSGKKVQHLERHQLSMLTDDEARIRFQNIIERLNYLINRY